MRRSPELGDRMLPPVSTVRIELIARWWGKLHQHRDPNHTAFSRKSSPWALSDRWFHSTPSVAPKSPVYTPWAFVLFWGRGGGVLSLASHLVYPQGRQAGATPSPGFLLLLLLPGHGLVLEGIQHMRSDGLVTKP